MSEAEPAPVQASPGRALAAARAELNLSIADVSQQIKYGIKQITAIEAGDYSKLPGATFVRGMIRSYAKLVQLDPEPLLADLGRRDIPSPITVDLRTDRQEPFLEGGRKSNRVYAYMSLTALLAVAIVAYEWYVSPPSVGEVVTVKPRIAKNEAVPAPASVPEQLIPTDPQPPAAELPPRPDATLASKASNAPGGSKRVELEFDEQSWVEIRQANGKVLLSQLNPAGSKQSIEGVPPFQLVIGNAAHVQLRYDNAPVDLRPHFKVDVARLKLE